MLAVSNSGYCLVWVTTLGQFWGRTDACLRGFCAASCVICVPVFVPVWYCLSCSGQQLLFAPILRMFCGGPRMCAPRV
jgi:hypothetical protein